MTWKEYIEEQALKIGWKVDGEKLYRWFIWKAPGIIDAENAIAGIDIPESVLYRAFRELK